MLLTHTDSSQGWLNRFLWSVLFITLMKGNTAFAAFTDDIAAGVDNTGFTYIAYQDGSNAPFFVASEGVGSGDAVRTGLITQSTTNLSAENGFYFDFACGNLPLQGFGQLECILLSFLNQFLEFFRNR